MRPRQSCRVASCEPTSHTLCGVLDTYTRTSFAVGYSTKRRSFTAQPQCRTRVRKFDVRQCVPPLGAAKATCYSFLGKLECGPAQYCNTVSRRAVSALAPYFILDAYNWAHGLRSQCDPFAQRSLPCLSTVAETWRSPTHSTTTHPNSRSIIRFNISSRSGTPRTTSSDTFAIANLPPGRQPPRSAPRTGETHRIHLSCTSALPDWTSARHSGEAREGMKKAPGRVRMPHRVASRSATRSDGTGVPGGASSASSSSSFVRVEPAM